MLVRWALPITVAGVVAAGAIGSSRLGEEVRDVMQAGADVVQIYTGLIYHGPALVGQAAREIKNSC